MKRILFILPFIVLTLYGFHTHAATWYVGPNANGSGLSANDPTDIYSATSLASSGDEILLESGNYNLVLGIPISKSLEIKKNPTYTTQARLNCSNYAPCFDLGFSSSHNTLLIEDLEFFGGTIQIHSSTNSNYFDNRLTIKNVIFSEYTQNAIQKTANHNLIISINDSEFLNPYQATSINFYEGYGNSSTGNELYVNNSEFFNTGNGGTGIEICRTSYNIGREYNVNINKSHFSGVQSYGVTACTGANLFHLTIEENDFINLKTAIYLPANNNKITYDFIRLEVYKNNFLSSENGIHMDTKFDDAWVRIYKNNFFTFWQTAVSLGGRYDFYIERNRFFDTDTGIYVDNDAEYKDIPTSDDNPRIENNLFEKGRIAVAVKDSFVDFRFNTVVQNSGWGIGFSYFNTNSSNQSSVAANVFYQNNKGMQNNSNSSVIEYVINLFYQNSQDTVGTFTSTGTNLYTDPLYSGTGVYDSIQSGSPLVNATNNITLNVDINDKARITTADIGCFEFK